MSDFIDDGFCDWFYLGDDPIYGEWYGTGCWSIYKPSEIAERCPCCGYSIKITQKKEDYEDNN